MAQTFFPLLGKLSGAADFVLLGRLHLCLLQMCLLSVWRPHILPIDHYVLINNMIRFHLKWWMDTNRFASRMFIHPPEPTTFLFTDASHSGRGAHLEPVRLSFHGCWSEDQSQLHINILEMMAIHFAHSPLLCYDFDRQYNSGLLYQQTRRNTFSQPMCRSMENPPLVPGICSSVQSSSYPRQIQHIGRPSIETRQATQNRMGFGSISSKRYFPHHENMLM